MASCGDANAVWVLSTNTEAVCYELADDFFEMQNNGLISKNMARISLAHTRFHRPP
jgi:hypothetical protein